MEGHLVGGCVTEAHQTGAAMSEIKTLYIAGPMTGLPDYNRPAFHEAAQALRAAGFTVLNPAETSLPPGADSWADYMRAGLAQVLAADGVALLPGWSQSRGAQLEQRVAVGLGLAGMPWHEWLTEAPIGGSAA